MLAIEPNSKPRLFNRRRLLGSAIGLGALLGWTALVEPHWLQTSYHSLRIANLPQSWQGLRVVQVSDLHVGRTSSQYLQGCLEYVNTLKPDLLVITGDFVDHTGGIEELPMVLAQLQPMPLGTLAC